MTISYITRRGPGNTHFNNMLTMWKWCEKNFGKPDYFKTWNGDFADSTDDWVKFTFYKEEYASWFRLMYPEAMTEEQFKWRNFDSDD